MKSLLYIIHRQETAANKSELEAHKLLPDVVNVVNFIKTKPLNTRIVIILRSKRGTVLETAAKLKDEYASSQDDKQAFQIC